MIPLAALGLLNPIFAGAAMGFSSVSVVTNSLRLLRFRDDRRSGPAKVRRPAPGQVVDLPRPNATPTVAGPTFRRAWRGYQRREVDTFVRQILAAYNAATDQITALADKTSQSLREYDQRLAKVAAITEQAVRAARLLRQEAEQDATSIRDRADQAADTLLARAEHAAQAITRQADQLRAAAERDTDTARRRVTDAERHAEELQAAAWQRCAAKEAAVAAAGTERDRQHVRAAQQALTEHLAATEHAIAVLRVRVDPAGQQAATSRATSATDPIPAGTD